MNRLEAVCGTTDISWDDEIRRPRRGGKQHGPTFLLHPQLDVLGDQNGGRKEVELESAKNVALVDAAVIEGDVEDPNGQVLQVLAPAPQKTAFKRSVHLGAVVILEPVYLRRRRRA